MMNLSDRITSWLNENNAKIVDQMRSLIASPWPTDAALYDFVFHGDSLSSGEITLMLFIMDSSAGQIDGGWPIGHWFGTVPAEIVENNELWDTTCAVLYPWLANRWHDAGGPASGRKAYICEHDDIESFDLNSKQRIDDSDKWDG